MLERANLLVERASFHSNLQAVKKTVAVAPAENWLEIHGGGEELFFDLDDDKVGRSS
jgi:hypothetical protein